MRRNRIDAAWLGDCIDCGACVRVCPTGVGIRRGPQLACIGRGLCVDACNETCQLAATSGHSRHVAGHQQALKNRALATNFQ